MPLWSTSDSTPGWHVRISRRARRLSMRVVPGGRVEVIVPPGVGIPAIERFVSTHREWAEKCAREFELHAPPRTTERPEEVALALLDRRWRVSYVEGRRRGAREVTDDHLQVRALNSSSAEASKALLPWLSRVASGHLVSELESLSRSLGIGYERVQLRRQRTRWGSCSSTGTISLNVSLVFQRPAVVRYLMIHELCHRRHLNHSARFWRLVESIEPEWRALDAELLRGWRNVPAWVFP
jgi:predicted metal-dependent hydrolase